MSLNNSILEKIEFILYLIIFLLINIGINIGDIFISFSEIGIGLILFISIIKNKKLIVSNSNFLFLLFVIYGGVLSFILSIIGLIDTPEFVKSFMRILVILAIMLFFPTTFLYNHNKKLIGKVILCTIFINLLISLLQYYQIFQLKEAYGLIRFWGGTDFNLRANSLYLEPSWNAIINVLLFSLYIFIFQKYFTKSKTILNISTLLAVIIIILLSRSISGVILLIMVIFIMILSFFTKFFRNIKIKQRILFRIDKALLFLSITFFIVAIIFVLPVKNSVFFKDLYSNFLLLNERIYNNIYKEFDMSLENRLITDYKVVMDNILEGNILGSGLGQGDIYIYKNISQIDNRFSAFIQYTCFETGFLGVILIYLTFLCIPDINKKYLAVFLLSTFMWGGIYLFFPWIFILLSRDNFRI